jgi:NAD-dependent deacetylase
LPTFSITWNGVPIRNLLTAEFFDRDPVRFYEMFREVGKWRDVAPNLAHYTLAETKMPVVTQNVDGLHQGVFRWIRMNQSERCKKPIWYW